MERLVLALSLLVHNAPPAGSPCALLIQRYNLIPTCLLCFYLLQLSHANSVSLWMPLIKTKIPTQSLSLVKVKHIWSRRVWFCRGGTYHYTEQINHYPMMTINGPSKLFPFVLLSEPRSWKLNSMGCLEGILFGACDHFHKTNTDMDANISPKTFLLSRIF